jgi:PST family polysaccharide transporter
VTSDDEATIRRKAASGAIVVFARTVAIRAVGLVSNLVLARIFSPHQFGELAVGMTIAAGVIFLTDAGLAAGLIRRTETPTRDDMRGVVTLQLLLLGALALVGAACAPLGLPAQITAVMLAGLPVSAYRTPGFVLLERALDYRRLAAVEMTEAVVMLVVSVPLALTGLGVWGVAIAFVARTVVGTVLMVLVSHSGWPRPLPHLGPLKAQLRFGFQFQAVGLVAIGREQFINLGVGAVAGLSTLGLWSFANRALQVAQMPFTSLWRVSFPAMVGFRNSASDPRALIERVNDLVCVGGALVLAPFAAGAVELVPFAFGEPWRDAGWVIVPYCLGLLLGAPVSVACAGWFYAAGAAGTVFRASFWHSALWVVLALALVPLVGAPGVGIAFVPAGLLELAMLSHAMRRENGARVAEVNLVAAVAFAAGVGAALGATAELPRGGLTGVAAAVIALVVTAALLGVVRRAALSDFFGVLDRRARPSRLLMGVRQ